MKRSWYGLLLLALLAPACKSASKVPPATGPEMPDLLRVYDGALRIVPHKGDQKSIRAKAGQALTGACDMAVKVESVNYNDGTARFALLTVGQPRVGARRGRCKRLQPELQLTVTGLPGGPVSPEAIARIDEVLLTPEAYLTSKGTAFDRPAGGVPSEVASQLPDAGEAERRLARVVIAWPQLLMSVEAASRAPSGRGRHERLVGFEGVVGTDGRLYRPQLRVSIDHAHETAIQNAVPFWRFAPARRASAPVGARVPLEIVLRVY